MRGTIRRRGKASWELKFDAARIDGKRVTRYASFKGTRKEAQAELNKLLAAADNGTLPEPIASTVGEYLTAWLDNSTQQSPKTLQRYRELLRLQIVPHLGGVKLQRLAPEHVESWHAKLIGAGLSRQTTLHAHRVLSLGLKRAVENGTLARNVAAIRKPPRVEDKELEVLQPAAVTAMLAKLEGHALHPVASLAWASGCRRGELLALQWADIDLARGVIRVERSVEETRQGLRIKPPKTRRGRRNVGIPSWAVDMLKAHRKRQLELRLALGMGGQPVLVFGTFDDELLSPDNLSRDWRRVVISKNLPRASFHSLRHSHVSMLLKSGVDVLTVSRRIGHAKASVTLDVYGHLIEGADAEAVAKMEGAGK